MGEKEEQITALEAAHQEMQDVLSGVDLRQAIDPDWSLREMLAHIAGWDEVTRKAIAAFLQGGPPFVLPPKGFDAINTEMAAAREQFSDQQVVEDWKQARLDLIQEIRKIPNEAFFARVRFPWGSEGTVSEMIQIIAEHEQEHASELKGMRAQS